MSEGKDGLAPKLSLDIELADDQETITNIRPVEWDEWLTLPVRQYDLSIGVKNGVIRCPVVVVCRNFDKIPYKTPHLNSQAIFERDGYTCVYCGNRFGKKDLNLDHVIPQSQGGKTTWGNIVCSCRACNSFKADKTPREAGMILLKRPTTPKAVPVSFSFKEAKVPSWKPFLHR
jgi:5-methylcytosine-specific restriction endonuclease McrA